MSDLKNEETLTKIFEILDEIFYDFDEDDEDDINGKDEFMTRVDKIIEDVKDKNGYY